MLNIEKNKKGGTDRALLAAVRTLFLPTVTSLSMLVTPAAQSATRDPVFSVPTGTTFANPHQVAISIPYNGVVRITRDGSTPNGSSPLYTGPLTVRWSETIKAIAIVSAVSSNVVTASYTLSATKFPPPSSGGTTPPVINLNHPAVGQ